MWLFIMPWYGLLRSLCLCHAGVPFAEPMLWPPASHSLRLLGSYHSLRRPLVRICRLWYGARVGGPKKHAVTLILRLFLYHFLHSMSSWCHESIHNNTNDQQTPPPCWWSRSPLQRHGFNESTPSEWQAALLMFVPRPLLKSFGRINKLK